MNKQILIVDDDPNIVDVLEGYLEDIPCHIHKANNGKSAIETLAQNSIDLLITDVIMPDMNGIMLCEYTRKHFPQIKILACSGGGSSGKLVASMALDEILDHGAHKALMKPFTEEEFLRKVHILLGVK
ncbi:MAG: response regulator [Bdellovibrio sp. CG12_big_fil_rev_8_21_14_0_65_39_13]|nr:MAG: response regulator [Bdellovibrio sp. CG22_combo_CG10-13_8_21_14_all_39_27]PIQ62430.1 MAG: response regulator [Bdellovibrio sp. CG12_big_fil_rev_8_21_14_0_65_39_13]PIR34097.1 MAG: response regulator [Bdellovibrio sp. CG11_big_fil_rev_8_21_14_0_20_39_38]PJB53681.1 MAG: response regulator [Bdellovibrio sp. CG_4_9_14_3_um_filter_39_7]